MMKISAQRDTRKGVENSHETYGAGALAPVKRTQRNTSFVTCRPFASDTSNARYHSPVPHHLEGKKEVRGIVYDENNQPGLQ